MRGMLSSSKQKSSLLQPKGHLSGRKQPCRCPLKCALLSQSPCSMNCISDSNSLVWAHLISSSPRNHPDPILGRFGKSRKRQFYLTLPESCSAENVYHMCMKRSDETLEAYLMEGGISTLSRADLLCTVNRTRLSFRALSAIFCRSWASASLSEPETKGN